MLLASLPELFFDQVTFVEGAPPSCLSVTLTNTDEESALQVRVTIKFLPNEEFPAKFLLIDMADLGISAMQEVDAYSLDQFMEAMTQGDIILQSRETRNMLAVLLPVVPTAANALVRTSFFNVSSQLCLQGWRTQPPASDADQRAAGTVELELPVSAVFCTPILYADETDVDFEQCSVGETYVRDIQLWNRSECALFYRIAPFAVAGVNEEDLKFQDFESGRILTYSAPQKIASFASRRIRIIFRSSRLGEARAVFHVENIKNPSNKLVLECRVSVVGIEGESDVLLEDLGGGAAAGPPTPVGAGRALHFGDCYYHVETKRRARIVNRSKLPIQLQLRSDTPEELLFYLQDASSCAQPAFDTAALATRPTATTRGDELWRNRRAILEAKGSQLGLGVRVRGQLEAKGSQLTLAGDGDGGAAESSTSGLPGVAPGSLLHDLYDEHVSSQSHADDEDDAAPAAVARYQKAPPPSLAIDTWTASSKTVDKVKLHSSYDVAAYFARNVCSAYGELPDNLPGAFLRGHARRGAASAASNHPVASSSSSSRIVPKGQLAAEHTTTAAGTEISSATQQGIAITSDQLLSKRPVPPLLLSSSKSIPLGPGASVVVVLCLHPKSRLRAAKSDFGDGNWADKADAGSLVTKAFKLSLLWTSDALPAADVVSGKGGGEGADQSKRGISGKSDGLGLGLGLGLGRNGKSDGRVPIFSNSLTIQCKARVCQSIISVTPAALNLGECSVGELRAAVFNVQNNSDLPALVLPFVESETLGVVDAEVAIPPRQSRQVRLEYVARLENTDYKRSATLFNAYNSYGNVDVEIQARNVDTHQVLLHSLFYTLITRNTRRQLQVDMGNVLCNIPNLRTFSIRNIYSEPLTLEITAISNALTAAASNIAGAGATAAGGLDDAPPAEQFEIKIFLLRSSSSSKASTCPSSTEGGKAESESESRFREIEDLKWGAGNKTPTTRKRAGSGVAAISSYDDGTGGGYFKGADKPADRERDAASTPDSHEAQHAYSENALFAKKAHGLFNNAEDRSGNDVEAGMQVARSAADSMEIISRFDNADFPLNLLGLQYRYLHDTRDAQRDKEDESKERESKEGRGEGEGQAQLPLPLSGELGKVVHKSFESLYSDLAFADDAVSLMSHLARR